MPFRALLARLIPGSRHRDNNAHSLRWTEVAALHQALRSAQPATVVDVRNPDEVAGRLGCIPGARNLPLGELAQRLGELNNAREGLVVLVCLTDRRSAAAAALLRDGAFTDVMVLRGGMRAWRQAGH
jgi:rhodanese-related sulfurtransferase